MFEKRQKFFTQARKKYKIKKRKESDSRREMIERKEGISRITGNFVVYTMKQV